MKTTLHLSRKLKVLACLLVSFVLCVAAEITVFQLFAFAVDETEHTHVSTGVNVATLTHKAVCDDCGEPYVTMIDKIELVSSFDFTNVQYGDIGLKYNSEYGVVVKNNPVCKFLSVERIHGVSGYNLGLSNYWQEGSYAFAIKIEVMSAYRDIYDFAPHAVADVNGEVWKVKKDSDSKITCTSPEFTIEKTEIEIQFHNFNGWVPSRMVGESYSSDIIKGYVFGGKKPYKFSKVSGPDWLDVAEDGRLTGTPTETAPETHVVIRVTDATDTYKEISFLVGEVSKAIDLDALSVLDKLEIITDFMPPIYGKKGMAKVRSVIKSYKYGVSLYNNDNIKYLIGGKEEYFKDSAFYLAANEVFGEGTYTAVLSFYNYIHNSQYYKFDETTEVLIDGEPWQVLKVETNEKRSDIVICKEYEVGPYEHAEHVSTGDNVATATRKAVCDVCGESYKTEINYIKMTATVDIEGIKYGDAVLPYAQDYGLKVVNCTEGIIRITGYYLKPDEARYRRYYTEGVYLHEICFAIEDACKDVFYFASDVEAEVNGKSWSLNSGGMTSCGFDSPSFTIVKDENIFKFDDKRATVPGQKKGEAIKPIDLNDCVIGGKSPYTFTKISGPTWLTVTIDGKVSGTPDLAGKNEALVIRVTDANGKTCEASVSVDPTYFEADLTTLPELKKISITSDFSTPVFGEACKFEYTFAVTEQEDIEFYPMTNSDSETLLWLKGSLETGRDMKQGDRFEIGTYTALICAFRYHIGENDVKFAEDLEASVNGEAWGVAAVYNEKYGAQVILYKEFKVTDDGHVHEYDSLIQEALATCTSKGMKAHYECSTCHALFDENKAEKTQADLELAIDPTAHKFDEWQAEQPANCATVGVKAHKTCEYCKKYFDEADEEIAQLSIQKNDEHDLTEGWSKSSEGHYHLCERNGCKNENRVDFAEHTPDRAEATEDDPVVCTICGYVIVPVKGHEHSVKFVRGFAETCTENGQKDYYECADGTHPCHKRFKDSAGTQEIPDDSWIVLYAHHVFTSWIEEVPATVEADGVKAHKDCIVCHKHFDQNGNEVTDAVLKIEKLPKPEQPTDGGKKDNGLSGGAIVCIVIGGIAVVGIGGFAIFWFVVKKKTFADFCAAIKVMFKKR